MDGRFDLWITGRGGQGALLIGRMLAEAAASQYKYTSFFPNYGPTMRQGDSECTVILSQEEIASPVVDELQAVIVMGLPPPTVLLGSSGVSLETFEKRVQRGGLLIMDSSLTEARVKRDDIDGCYIPATRIALGLGNPRVANFVLLGAYLEATKALLLETVEMEIERKMGGRREELIRLNKAALEDGASFVSNLRG